MGKKVSIILGDDVLEMINHVKREYGFVTLTETIRFLINIGIKSLGRKRG